MPSQNFAGLLNSMIGQSVEAMHADGVEREQTIKPSQVNIGPAAAGSLAHCIGGRDGGSQQQVARRQRGVRAAGEPDGKSTAAGMAAERDRPVQTLLAKVPDQVGNVVFELADVFDIAAMPPRLEMTA